MTRLKENALILGLFLALSFLAASTFLYPGGSQADANSVGYDVGNNYISNLFDSVAINGEVNPAKPIASIGMILLCASFALFFYQFSKKISEKPASNMIKYCGLIAMVAGSLTVTPLHNYMLLVGGTLSLISMFYITFFIFKSKLHFLKMLSVICLLSAYACNYVYYTRDHLNYLPILQKVSLLISILWIIALDRFSNREDFVK